MRVNFLILLVSVICGCSQTPKEEKGQNENWFFWSVDWHPTKEQVVLGGSNDTFLKLLSTNSFQELKTYPYKGTITKSKWHPSKNLLAISVQDGKSKPTIFNVEKEASIDLDSLPKAGARAIGWNHSGKLLAVGSYDGYLSIFDEEGSVLKKVNTHQKSIIGLDWHPKENLIVAVGEDISLYYYDSDSLTHLQDREEDVLMLCVDWHPSGEFFVTGDYGDFEFHYPPLLQYWSYDGQRIKAIEESKAELRNIKWSSDGDLLATASEKIRLWNIDGDIVAEEESENLLWGIDWNPDATRIVATDTERKIIFWDRSLKSLKELQY